MGLRARYNERQDFLITTTPPTDETAPQTTAERLFPHDLFLPGIWAMRRNLTAYDAAYVALAEGLRAPMVTRDAALAGSPGHRARVELIE